MTRISMLVGAAVASAIVACGEPLTTIHSLGARVDAAMMDSEGRYIVVFESAAIPEDFSGRVANLNGTVESSHVGIGVAAVSGLSESAVAQLLLGEDVAAIEPNTITTADAANHDDPLSADDPQATSTVADATATALDVVATAEVSPTTAQFYARQWNMRAIFAHEAWAAGHLGSSDVIVALLDTGLDYLHPDFAGLVDLSRSVSLTSDDDAIIAQRFPGRLSITDLGWHGTAVASVIANKGTLLAGVNRHVTFMVVKIWNRNLQGPIETAIAGIMYAADNGADVINLSGNYTFNKSERPGTIAAFQRAVNYAFRKGAVVVSPAGNDAADLDHDSDRVRLPCQAGNAICVRATGPTSAAALNGPWVDVDASAPYAGFGRSSISVAAPSGTGNTNSGQRIWVLCSKTVAVNLAPACFAGQPIAQPSGSSFAAAHTSGLAALIVAKIGHGNPAQVWQTILSSADDLGQPGVDPLYGRGRINVARALELR